MDYLRLFFTKCVFMFTFIIIFGILLQSVEGFPFRNIEDANDDLDAIENNNEGLAASLNFIDNALDDIKDVKAATRLFTDETDLEFTPDTSEFEKPTAKIRITVTKRSGRFWEPWELNHNICPPSLCTSSEENRPRGTAGSVFYNGDIVLDQESEKHIYGNSLRQIWWRRAKRATMRSSRLWKGGIVPYMFADGIASKSKTVIKKAMKEIENVTCIRFRRKKLRDEDYIRFISEPGCWSNVGKVGGEQKVSIGRGCERVGTAIHEISHSLGFWHEQARPDRDQFVHIIEENISPRYLPDFDKANKSLVSSRGFPYDYESVMHYSEKAFTNLGEITIQVIGVGKKLKMKIGQRDALSTIDIAQLRDMYNCNDKEDDNATYCPSGWKKNIRTCYKFEPELREQFSGAQRYCEKLNSNLLIIDDKKEDSYIKKRLKKKFPDVTTWRTAGRLVNGTFMWNTKGKPEPMVYTKWGQGLPSTYSSMALVLNKTRFRMGWRGVWLGSANQMPEHAYAFICERRARRKCVADKYKDGRNYRGTLDHTIDGHTCQKWSSQYPQSHKLLPFPYKDNGKQTREGLGNHNYCRNPLKRRRSKPWCFTNKNNLEWQYCDVSVCTNKDAGETNKQVQKPKPSYRDLDTDKKQKDSPAGDKRGGSSNNKKNQHKDGKNNNNKKDNQSQNSNGKVQSNSKKNQDNPKKNSNKKNENNKKNEANKNNVQNNNKKGQRTNNHGQNNKRRHPSNNRKNNSNKRNQSVDLSNNKNYPGQNKKGSTHNRRVSNNNNNNNRKEPKTTD